MEVGLVALLVLVERGRPDLWVRRAWAGLALPRPALPVHVPVPVALAGLDLRRVLLRITTLLVAYASYRVYAPPLPSDVYEAVNGLTGFYLAFLGLGLLAVVASIGGRDREVELVQALPAGPRSRLGGWMVLLIVVALAEWVLLLGLRYGPDAPVSGALLPGPWELAQGPIMLLGGGLLGLLLARVLPGWVAAIVGVVGSVAWVALQIPEGRSTKMLAPLTEWVQFREDGRVVFEPGSFAWHNGFLLGLCALAAITALLVEEGRRRVLVGTGAAVLVGTVAAGVLALP